MNCPLLSFPPTFAGGSKPFVWQGCTLPCHGGVYLPSQNCCFCKFQLLCFFTFTCVSRLYPSLPWWGLPPLPKLLPLSQPISLRQQPPHTAHADHHGENEDALQALRNSLRADAHLRRSKQHQVEYMPQRLYCQEMLPSCILYQEMLPSCILYQEMLPTCILYQEMIPSCIFIVAISFLGCSCCFPQVYIGLRNPWKWQQHLFRFLAFCVKEQFTDLSH